MKKFLLALTFIGLTFAAATGAAADPLAVPGMTGPLAPDADPYSVDAGPLGKIDAGGVVSGFGMEQSNRTAADHDGRYDFDNAQFFVQKADGPVQFYVQGGAYTLPALGTPYRDTINSTGDLFGPVPVAYVKLAPNDHFSIQAGKLYTFIGTENSFTFQNYNIERGLLWNQTNAVNRGVQANFSDGAWSGSVALGDGFYSGRLNWLSGILTYTADAENSVTAIASGNIDHDGRNSYVTPLAQDNSQIYDLTFTHSSGPWTISPTLQYTHVPQDASIGLMDTADSYGAALAGSYRFTPQWSMAARAEYIDTSGGTNIAYGPGSNAWSLTLTPTWQRGIFFARGEASYVKAEDTAAGSAFGTDGNATSQGRLLVETGVLF